ncbi:MAG TPA: hypothetical protein VFC79_13275 [Tissierellaceae bacterium]|nr:hypothetical protein [Tissierellaceae bacterium]
MILVLTLTLKLTAMRQLLTLILIVLSVTVHAKDPISNYVGCSMQEIREGRQLFEKAKPIPNSTNCYIAEMDGNLGLLYYFDEDETCYMQIYAQRKSYTAMWLSTFTSDKYVKLSANEFLEVVDHLQVVFKWTIEVDDKNVMIIVEIAYT